MFEHVPGFDERGTTQHWLNHQGQLASLKVTFDQYLLQIFGMLDAGHTHFAGIVEGMAEPQAAKILDAVETKAREACAAIKAQRAARRSRPLTGADLE